MATYFHGAPPEIQSDDLQTLYLMNPSYVGYSDAAAAVTAAAAPPNMLLFNSTMSSINPMSQQHHQQQQHFVGVPLQNTVPPPAPPQDSGRQYNLWTTVAEGRQHTAQQGLSLSLSSQQAAYAAAYQSDGEVLTAVTVDTTPPWTAAASSASGLQSVLMGSKYLKAAQLLLDEVVNVGNGVKRNPAAAAAKSPVKSCRTSEGGCDGDASSRRSTDLSTTERQELQMKKAKLVNMLDEVEQRYRQYRHQMPIVVSTYEAMAGPGSAKAYTALALRTISKQFRSLRDAISDQIRSTSKNLGEELDCVGVGGTSKLEGGGSSRLRLVDHHLRQQRALQQIGMIQHNAWRPQRGLPERSVSILRAWLFEHFLHPYPKDSDKLMLAKQTGLTRSQVSNWFINARVRLWKPMVEEMYLEEVKEQDQNNNGDDKSKFDHQSNANGGEESSSTSSPSRSDQTHGGKEKIDHQILCDHYNQSVVLNHGNQALMPSPRIKRARNDESLHANPLIHPDETSNCELLMKFGIVNQNAGYGSYCEQFAPAFPGNGVSLTLGLPPSEYDDIGIGRSLEISNAGSDFCSMNNNSNPSINQPSSAYENINIQSRKRFAARLLQDFVS